MGFGYDYEKKRKKTSNFCMFRFKVIFRKYLKPSVQYAPKAKRDHQILNARPFMNKNSSEIMKQYELSIVKNFLIGTLRMISTFSENNRLNTMFNYHRKSGCDYFRLLSSRIHGALCSFLIFY